MTEVTPIPKAPRAKKRRQSMPAEVVDEVLRRSRGLCECDPMCMSLAEHLHHRRRRSRGGANTAQNLLHLARACHDDAHANPTASHARGLLLRAGDPEWDACGNETP